MTVEIASATVADLESIRTLFREYEADIGIDLCFQGFERELAGLPGSYSPPQGRLLIARSNQEPIGCVALRPFTFRADTCEMKRLYLCPKARGTGIGGQLVDRILSEARSAAYRSMVLDTLATMTAARSLYRRLGFREIPPYYANPLPGVVYLELDLVNCR